MTTTLTAQDMLRDGIHISLVGYTQGQVAYARAELVELAAGVKGRLERAGEVTPTTSRVVREAIEFAELNLGRYTEGIDAIDRLPA